jgi:tRNA modification GTPase
MDRHNDTIAAIATGNTVSAIGIVRLSGPRAAEIARALVRTVAVPKPHRLCYGEILDEHGEVIDAGLVTISRAPHSYTGEDTAELHCHGSPVVLAEVLRAAFRLGARQAAAGDFTKRAVLNGRLDLTQAEAVIDLIEAETAALAKNAAGQLNGAVVRKTDDVCGVLLDIAAHFYAVVDYPDEDVGAFELTEYAASLGGAARALTALRDTFTRGAVLNNGVPTAIIGRPNVGKSSLLNALVGFERAIVTASPGTTRDTVEEKLRAGNVLLRLTDTAGIRRAADEAETLGVARARRAAGEASLVLAVFDGSEPRVPEDGEVIAAAGAARKIAVINKADLPRKFDISALENEFEMILPVSAKTGDGVAALTARIESLFTDAVPVPSGELLTNARQHDAVRRALESVSAALSALQSGVTPDAVLLEIETALAALGELTGKTVREEVTARIFERFCVGK